MADSEDELDETLYTVHQASPDQGLGLQEEEEEGGQYGTVQRNHFVSSVSSFMEVIVTLILYIYVLVSFLRLLILPASFTPLVVRQYRSDNNVTDVNALMKDIGFNGLLMFIFVLQHSLMHRLNIDAVLHKLNMAPFSRALYTITTCIVLEFIHWLWRPIPYQLWHCPDDSTLFLGVMGTIHTISWFLIAFSAFTVDYLELLGIKQLYYHYKGLEPPLLSKSDCQRDLYSHMRHPLLLCPIIVLWAVPTMSYDRLLVAVMVPLYLIWGSKLNENDVFYVREMFKEKKMSLKYN